MGAIILQVFIPGFPKEILLIQSGIVFGIFWGSILNWLSMILAAQVGYEVVRKSVETGGKYAKILEEYQEWAIITKLSKKGNPALFGLRLIPNGPNDILSLVSGALLLPRRGYIIVSVITSLPYAILLAYLGDQGSDFIDQLLVLYLNLLIFLLTVVIYVINKRKRSRLITQDPDTP